MYPEDDQFNQFLSLAIQQTIQSETKVNKQLASMSSTVDLIHTFNDTRGALGCPVDAVYHCPALLQSIDKNEHKDLKKYKKEKEENASDSDSNP